MTLASIDSIVGAFSEEQVGRLTGLSVKQLRYWDRTGFYVPALADENRRAAYSRIYSFRDVVALKTLGILRKQHDVPLQHLRQVADKLAHIKAELWTSTKLYVLNRKVIFHEPGTHKPREVVSGQYVIGIPLSGVVNDAKRDVKKLAQRHDGVGTVERSRHVAHNAWVVGGTRIPTAAIMRFHEAGYTVAQIIKEYPALTAKDVRAALKHESTGMAA